MALCWSKIWFFFCTFSYFYPIISGIQKSNSDGEYLLFEFDPNDDDYKPEFVYGSFHTLDRLSEWAMKEEFLVEVLSNRLELLDLEEELIESYLESYKESTEKAVKGLHDPTNNTPEGRGRVIGSSAVLAHRMTDRYTSIIPKLDCLAPQFIQKISPKFAQELEEDEEEVRRKYMDKYMSCLGFLNIQIVYGLEPAQIRLGLDVDTKYASFLTAKQCAEIGALALARQYYYLSIEWLELAKSLLTSETEEDNTIPIDLVSSMLDIAINEVSQIYYHHNIGVGLSMWNTSRGILDFYIYPTYEGEEKTARIPMNQLINNDPELRADPFVDAAFKYWSLCSGVTFQTPKTQASLKCFYESKKHPYLYINPLKTEILSENPPLFQFYDVLSNDSIEKIKSVAVPRLELSELVGTEDVEIITIGRTSAGTFMKYQEMSKVYDHSEIISGLKLILASEMAQVVEYTYSRFYTHHTDALEGEDETPEEIEAFGDRAATMLYYLETATVGGDTPFCSAGVNARPVRGSSILWYNLYRNGTVRQDVRHGACPIIHGHKISNKTNFHS